MKNRFDRVRSRYIRDDSLPKPKVKATVENTNEGDWLCHSETKIWIEVTELVDDIAVGLTIKDKVATFPVKECHHSVTWCKST